MKDDAKPEWPSTSTENNGIKNYLWTRDNLRTTKAIRSGFDIGDFFVPKAEIHLKKLLISDVLLQDLKVYLGAVIWHKFILIRGIRQKARECKII